MTDDHEWSEWRDHDGKGCPVVGAIVEAAHGGIPNEVFTAGAHTSYGILRPTHSRWHWARPENLLPAEFYILRYRVRKPRALRDLIELVENLPAPAKSRETVQ